MRRSDYLSRGAEGRRRERLRELFFPGKESAEKKWMASSHLGPGIEAATGLLS